MTLRDQGIYTGRSMIQKTFKERGLKYVSSLALQNVNDLKKIIEWNIANGFKLFRASSDIFPWNSEYEYKDLPDYHEIGRVLMSIGTICKDNNHRLSFHPDHFNKLASPDLFTVNKSLRDIEQHSRIFDLMGFEPSRYNKINIHVGGAYGDKYATMQRFCKNFKSLSENAQKRLTVENDDKGAMYSVKDLYHGVFQQTGVPIVFDFHHHKFNNGGMSEQEAFKLACLTWDGFVPVCHYSESAEDKKPQAHSDYVECNCVNSYGKDVDIIIEAKMKELAVLKLIGKE
jgi:UV DNA damage endonuclease